ncbi:MAG: hypothetical protein L0Y56_10830 [Nitrospira sp.]|nr:hypothetical protein [Nitrospira sp.]
MMIKTWVAATLILTLTPAILFSHEKTWPGRQLKQTYAEATRFTSQQVTLSSTQVERIERDLKSHLTPEDRRPTFYPAYQDDQRIGMVIFVDETGPNGVIEIGVALNNLSQITAVKILDHREKGAIRSEEFLQQFIGKSPLDVLKMQDEITPHPKAVDASKAIIRGVIKALLLKREVLGN